MKKIKQMLSLMLIVCMMFGNVTSAVAAEQNVANSETVQVQPEIVENIGERSFEAESQVESDFEETEKELESSEIDDGLVDISEELGEIVQEREELEIDSVEQGIKSEDTINVDASIETPKVILEEVTEMVEAKVVNSSATTITPKPETGKTVGQPFASNTAGSQYFRIPALIETIDSDGREVVVAAADARWNGTMDAGGIDTLVSYTTDAGENWNYTYANYLGDNNLVFDTNCATFIDPALAYDKASNTLYMLVDLYVAGYAINTAPTKPVSGAAFTKDGYLKLKASGKSSYDYYLKDGRIYGSDNQEVTDYKVDNYFNILDTNDNIVSNLFYADGAYQAFPTTYLYLTKSTDNGKTWSEPQLLNVKNDTEYFYGIAPGRGLVTKDGTIMYSCYVYGGSNESQKSSVIYSKDNGATWERTSDAVSTIWSSESQLVELDNGTIRMFFRNGQSQICYVDAAPNETEGYVWGDVVKTGISNHSNCQISAIKYSKKINGKEAIIISCPTNTSSRSVGKIFVVLVGTDGKMDFNTVPATTVTTDTYQYSCMAELQDGSIGLLYEDGDASIKYTSYTIENLLGSADVELERLGFVNESNQMISSLQIAKSEGPKDVSFAGLSEGQEIIVATSNENVATVNVVNNKVTITPVANGTAQIMATVQQANARTIANGTTYTLTVTVADVSDDNKGAITETQGLVKYVLDTDGIDSGEEYLIVYGEYALSNIGEATGASTGRTQVSVSGSEVTGLTESAAVDALWTISASGTGYTIKNKAAYVYLYYNSTLSNRYEQECTITLTDGTYRIYGYNRYLRYQSSSFGASNSASSNTRMSLFKKTLSSAGFKTDVSKLESKIQTAETYTDSSVYTVDSWNNLQTALSAAKTFVSALYETKAEAQAAQDSIDLATQTLENTMNALEIAPHTEELTVEVGSVISVEISGTQTTTPNVSCATVSIIGSVMKVTGVSVGQTSVTVGVVTYNINVIEQQPVGDGFKGGSQQAYHNGDTEGAGVNQDVRRLFTSVGVSYDLDLKSSVDGYSVVWESASNSVATVDQNGTVTGIAVGETIVKATVTDASGNLVCVNEIPVIVFAGSGSSSGRLVTFYVTSIVNTLAYASIDCSSELIELHTGDVCYVRASTGEYSAYDFFSAPMEGCILTRMSSSNSDGAYFNLWTTDSSGNKIVDKTDNGFYNGTATVAGAKVNGAGKNQIGHFGYTNGVDNVELMVMAAINIGCDGGMGFTRTSSDGASSGVSSTLVFQAEKIPTFEKSVAGVLGADGKRESFRAYEEGMTATVGEFVYFTLKVTSYEPMAKNADNTTTIDYSNFKLIDDELDGASFISYSQTEVVQPEDLIPSTPVTSKDITEVIEKEVWAVGENEKVHSYVVAYKITENDLDTTIKNKAKMSFNYSAKYSTGTYNSASEADAQITATSFVAKDLVVDFGLPVSVEYSAFGKSRLKARGTAKYGDVTVVGDSLSEKWTVTYTPHSVLKSVDVVKLIAEDETEYSFRVYPATTVYYEEGFAAYSEGAWVSTGSKGDTNQSVSEVKNNVVANQPTDSTNVANYGFDSSYADVAASSSQAKTTTKNAMVTFEFTGTGIDIYANCTEERASAIVQMYDSLGTLKKGSIVQTVKGAGTYDSEAKIIENADVLYNTPIISYSNLAYDTYTVTIKIVRPSAAVEFPVFYVDGFKVYGTLDPSSSVYAGDREANPQYLEMRDAVLAGVGGTTENSKYAEMIAANVYSQIFSSAEASAGAAILVDGPTVKNTGKDDSSIVAGEKGNYLDILDNGPKNEFYLYPGQSLVFALDGSVSAAQLGMKAVGDSTTYEVTSTNGTNVSVLSNGTLTAITDMFYQMGISGASGVVTITNAATSAGILSLTDMKYFAQTTYALRRMSVEEISTVLMSAGYPSEYSDATLKISLVDENNQVVKETVLVENGKTGEEAKFSVADIEKAVKTLIPKGYKLVDVLPVEDIVGTYGEKAELIFAIKAEKKVSSSDEAKEESNGSSDSPELEENDKKESQVTQNTVTPSDKEETVVKPETTKPTETAPNEETTKAPIIDEVAKVEDSTEKDVEVEEEETEVSIPEVEVETDSQNPIGLIIGSALAVVAVAVALFFGFKKKSKNK